MQGAKQLLDLLIHFDVVVLLDDVFVDSVRGRPQPMRQVHIRLAVGDAHRRALAEFTQPLLWQLVRVLNCFERVVLLGQVPPRGSQKQSNSAY